jgi:SMC interacting uncharacterized protein involved in chromosome segregation
MGEIDMGELHARQARMEEQIKGIYTRLEEQRELVESVHKMAVTMERLTSAQKVTADKVDTLTNDVNDLKSKPGKRWDTVGVAIMTCILTAAATRILTQLFG